MITRFPGGAALACAMAVLTLSQGCTDPRPIRATTLGAARGLTVASVVPSAGLPGVATTVNILGSGFDPGATVVFGGMSATVTNTNGTAIAAITPLGQPGPVDVTVTNPGGETRTLTAGYTYFMPPQLSVEPFSHAGSVAGGTYLDIYGTGFELATSVTIGGVDARIMYRTTGTHISLSTRPREAGLVDVVVRNPDGRSVTVPRGYQYVLAAFADFNGVWDGRAGDEGETAFQLRVENNAVVAVSCGATSLALAMPRPTGTGQFSFAEPGGTITGGLVNADYAEGTLRFPACSYETIWFATRR